MNQILSVEAPNNRKKSNKSSIHSIVMVFAIILMLFGIGLVSTGAYSYYKNVSSDMNNVALPSTKTKPIITIERESAANINLVVTHDKEIARVTYKINEEKTVEVDGEGQSELQESIELPTGSSRINITAEDINGVSASYETTFEVEQKPEIKLEQVENKIQVTVESQVNIDTIAYYWDDDQENAQTYTINDVKNVTLIDVMEGTHTLNIVATDAQGNKTTKTQKIIGDNKPTVEITTDGEYFNIKATDDESLTKAEITLNSNETITEEINEQEYSKQIKLEDGVNKLTVKVYNKNGISEIARVKFTKE